MIPDSWTLLALALAACAVAAGVSALARGLSYRLDLLDRPNHRSSHQRPTPRLGGLGILAAVALALVAAYATRVLPPAETTRLLVVGIAAMVHLFHKLTANRLN